MIVFLVCLGSVPAQDAPKRMRFPSRSSSAPARFDFEKEILPILKNNCLACHNQTKPKADLGAGNPQSILKGGESGPAVVPRKSEQSLMLKAAPIGRNRSCRLKRQQGG